MKKTKENKIKKRKGKDLRGTKKKKNKDQLTGTP